MVHLKLWVMISRVNRKIGVLSIFLSRLLTMELLD